MIVPLTTPMIASRTPRGRHRTLHQQVLSGLCLGGAVCTPLGACQDYLARRDTLTIGSGDAIHANMAKQVIDPWPAHAETIEPSVSGERMQRAIERYRNPGNGQNVAILPPVPIGPPNVPSVPAPATR